jgi:signal transduction histidine kinase
LSLLLARSNGGGAASTLDTERVHATIPPDISELLFRATQETLRNRDHTVPVTVRVSDRDNVASLDVIEHGGNGHVDLRALTDLVADAGGHLLVDAADNGGTRVHVEVPLQ